MQRLKNLQRLPTNKGDTMILETIADANKVRYEEIEKQVPLEVIKQKALLMETDNEFPFEKALAGKDISFICEVKKASPSKGIKIGLSQRIFPMFRLPRIMKTQVQVQFPF